LCILFSKLSSLLNFHLYCVQDGEESVASWELRVEGRLMEDVSPHVVVNFRNCVLQKIILVTLDGLLCRIFNLSYVELSYFTYM